MAASAVVEQFTQQAASFARLPGHEEATELLLDLAGVGAAHSVLDVACGPGLVACAAAQRARHVTGVDITPAMLEQARALEKRLGLGNVAWQMADAASLPFASARFDVVLTRYSLHHVADPDVVIEEMRRVARPGGRVAIADMVLEPHHAAAYDRMERLRDPSHVRTLSPGELRRLAAGAGLRDLRSSGYAFTIGVERLLKASFPAHGDRERVRAMLLDDVGIDRMGLGLEDVDGEVRLAYPVCIVSGLRE